MVVLGLLLLLLALVLGFLAFYGLPTADTQIAWDFLGNHFQISPVAVFFLGAATMLMLLLGLWLLLTGTRRSARKARELRELKKQQKVAAKADAERAREEDRLAAERARETTQYPTEGAHVDPDRR